MKSFIALVVTAIGSSAFALVDMKNANYSNTWVDFTMPGSGYQMQIARTYNSRSLHDGIFGFGWCSDFETSLEKTAEGHVKITECGDGAEVYFFPREFNKKDIEKTIAQIIEKVRASKKVDEATIKKLQSEMVFNHDLRATFANNYKVAIPVKEGTKFYANGRELEYIEFNKGVYTRFFPDDSYMRFDKDGRITHTFDKNGNFVKYTYDKDRLTEVVDNNGRRFSFKYQNKRKISSVTTHTGQVLEYSYKNLDDLASVKLPTKEVYGYEYDELHNLTKATYPDKTSIEVRYDKKNDWVIGFTDREKCVEAYGYESNPENPKMNYWSTVKKTCGKEVVHDAHHEFWYAERADGQIYLRKVHSSVNGNVSEITYHETFGKPISMRRNTERFNYDYYENGQIKTKEARFIRQNYKYDPKSSKVSEVLTETLDDKARVVSKRVTRFAYDPKGNLVQAENSDGQRVTMTYDAKGRIATLKDHTLKMVKIDYDGRLGKPAIVTRPGLGSISVRYKPSGEIDGVDSKEGPSVAMQIASTFNNYLDIISPANAELAN